MNNKLVGGRSSEIQSHLIDMNTNHLSSAPGFSKGHFPSDFKTEIWHLSYVLYYQRIFRDLIFLRILVKSSNFEAPHSVTLFYPVLFPLSLVHVSPQHPVLKPPQFMPI
jgi:hypothetical protein